MPCGGLRSPPPPPPPTLTSSSTRKKESFPPFSQPFPYFICISLTRSQTACSRPFPLAKRASLSFRSRLKTREMEAYATSSSRFRPIDIVLQASKSPRRRPLFPFPSLPRDFIAFRQIFVVERLISLFMYLSWIDSFYYPAVSFTCIYFLRIPRLRFIQPSVKREAKDRGRRVCPTSYSRTVNCILLNEKLAPLNLDNISRAG